LLLTGCFGKREIKTYRIFSSTKWEGVNLHGSEKSLQGFSEDLFYEVAKREDFKVEFNVAINSLSLQLLDKKQVDAILTTQVPTPRNEKTYLFSEPFFSFGPVLLIRSKDTFSGYEALKHKVIGFERSWESTLMAQADSGYIFKPYDQVIALVEDLLNGKLDAIILDSIYAHQLGSGLYLDKIKVVAALPNAVEFRLVVKRGKNDELIALFNRGLADLKEESTYQKILNYWALPTT
jgi:polar amino acid transport system substrate-binding protein